MSKVGSEEINKAIEIINKKDGLESVIEKIGNNPEDILAAQRMINGSAKTRAQIEGIASQTSFQNKRPPLKQLRRTAKQAKSVAALENRVRELDVSYVIEISCRGIAKVVRKDNNFLSSISSYKKISLRDEQNQTILLCWDPNTSYKNRGTSLLTEETVTGVATIYCVSKRSVKVLSLTKNSVLARFPTLKFKK